MTKFLMHILAGDMYEIHFRWRVSTNIVHVMIFKDKEFSLLANYPKGHGHEFKLWLNKYHPAVLLVAVKRVTGQRHELPMEGAAAIYWNRKYFIELLNYRLIETDKGKGNILQTNLIVVLSCMELVSMCCVYAIFHSCINIPLCCLSVVFPKLHLPPFSPLPLVRCSWVALVVSRSSTKIAFAMTTAMVLQRVSVTLFSSLFG